MPVREKLAGELAEKFVGVHWWNNASGRECQTMPTEKYDEARDAADAAYAFIVGRIDWPRVLLEASSRHLSLLNQDAHPTLSRYAPGGDEVCPECIREALLALERLHEWVVDGKPAPTPPARGGDWPVVLADSVRYRQPADALR